MTLTTRLLSMGSQSQELLTQTVASTATTSAVWGMFRVAASEGGRLGWAAGDVSSLAQRSAGPHHWSTAARGHGQSVSRSLLSAARLVAMLPDR